MIDFTIHGQKVSFNNVYLITLPTDAEGYIDWYLVYQIGVDGIIVDSAVKFKVYRETSHISSAEKIQWYDYTYEQILLGRPLHELIDRGGSGLFRGMAYMYFRDFKLP